MDMSTNIIFILLKSCTTKKNFYVRWSLADNTTDWWFIHLQQSANTLPHPNKHKMPINYTPGKTTVDFFSLWGTTRIQVLSDSMSWQQPQPQSCRLKVNLLWKSPLAGQRHDLLYLFTNNLLVLIDNGAVLLTRFLIRFSIKWRQNGSQNFICDKRVQTLPSPRPTEWLQHTLCSVFTEHCGAKQDGKPNKLVITALVWNLPCIMA